MIAGREAVSQQEIQEAVERTCRHHSGIKQLERACGSIPRIGERRLSLLHAGSIHLIETLQRQVYLAPHNKRGGGAGGIYPDRDTANGSYIDGHIITNHPVTARYSA